jgi:hypothetical protein
MHCSWQPCRLCTDKVIFTGFFSCQQQLHDRPGKGYKQSA